MEYINEIEERVILVGVQVGDEDTQQSLDELEELADTAGAITAGKIIQSREAVHPGTYIGKGKIEEVRSLMLAVDATGIICDDELSPAQMNNLEHELECKVMDRTLLILDIFAKHATTSEGKIQVELAQLRYRSARLVGLRASLSRLGGGIGTRGPGEKKLETDRRLIRKRITALKEELSQVERHRELLRTGRSRGNLKTAAIVGYTNAGKSTLRNALCEVAARKENNQKENVFEADMLFATLDTTTRAITLKNKGIATLTDTVGFVRKLPHDLVEAFKSTLEEVIFSDLLCHVVDASSEDAIEQIRAVEGVLEELGAKDKDTILVLNKVDKGTEEQLNKIKEEVSYEDIIEISAKEGLNLDKLLELIEEKLPYKYKKAEYMIPYSKGDVVSFLHRNGRILEEEYKDEGTYLVAEVDEEVYNKSKEYVINILS